MVSGDLLHHCISGGWLFAGDGFVPADQADFRDGVSMVGCNRLRCANCGHPVRHRHGVECRNLQLRLIDLMEAQDWDKLAFLRPSAGRLYACRCTGWLETSMHALADPDADAGDPVLPWRCDGHPHASLPVDIDGVRFDSAGELDLLVERALSGWSPASAPPPGPWFPSAWLIRVRARLDGTRLAESMDRSVAQRVVAGLPSTMGSALRFFCAYPRTTGFESVLDFAERPGADLLGNWSTRYDSGTVEISVLDALRARIDSAGAEPDELDCRAERAVESSLDVVQVICDKQQECLPDSKIDSAP
jgi:hypothetical protein